MNVSISPLSALRLIPPLATDLVCQHIYTQTLIYIKNTDRKRRPLRPPRHPRRQRPPNARHQLQHPRRHQSLQQLGHHQRLRRYPHHALRQRRGRAADVPSVSGAWIAASLVIYHQGQVADKRHLSWKIQTGHAWRRPQRRPPCAARTVPDLPKAHHGAALRRAPGHLEPQPVLRVLGL